MMKKMLRENKGFSLVELLVAILIMAVIAGTAITLFGGVLNSSRNNADKETAESIKRAVLTYMNSTNDVDLSCLGVKDGITTSADLIKALGLEIEILADKVAFTAPGGVETSMVKFPASSDIVINSSDIKGKVGPFLDISKDMTAPTAPDTKGWRIEIDKNLQVVVVTALKTTDASKTPTVAFVSGSSASGGAPGSS